MRERFASHSIPVVDGELYFWPHYIPAAQAWQYYQQLQHLPWQQDTLLLHGREVKIPRLQAWFSDEGLGYAYSGLALQPQPLTPALRQLQHDVQRLSEADFNSVLANYYRCGKDSVAWHSDDEAELGENPLIASLSFGSTRTFSLKHKHSGRLLKLDLPPGSLLIMAGCLQHHWLHQLAKTRRQLAGRINLTFRQIKSVS